MNASQEANMELSEKVKAFERKSIVAEACEGLAATEAAKLTELSEAIEAEDNSDFASKVATIKESYLNKDETQVDVSEIDAISEESEKATVLSDSMQSYLSAISSTK